MKELNLKQLEKVSGGRLNLKERLKITAIVATVGTFPAAVYWGKNR